MVVVDKARDVLSCCCCCCDILCGDGDSEDSYSELVSENSSSRVTI